GRQEHQTKSSLAEAKLQGRHSVWSSAECGASAPPGTTETLRPFYTALRPVTRLMISTITAITKSRWIKPPPMWKPHPNSQRISRIAKIVQSILVTYGQQGCRKQ